MKTLFIKPIAETPSLPAKLERRTRIKLMSAIALAVVGVTAWVVLPAGATPQVGVSSETIAQGAFDEIDLDAKTDMDPGPARDWWKAKINTKGASRLYVVRNTVQPGGSFGWHSHPGPTFVIVVSGTATEYHGDDPTATPITHAAGTTFIDEGDTAGHLVRNDGTVNLVVVAVRLFPEGAIPRIDLPNPGYVPALN